MPKRQRDSSPETSDELDSPIEEEVEVEEEEEGEEEEEEEVEEEEEEGDEEEEEVEEEVEEEEEEEEEEGEGDEEEAKDTSKKLESEGPGEYLKLVSSTPGRSESNPVSPSKDATHGSFVAYDSSAKISSAADSKEAADFEHPFSSAVQDKHISSEEKGCSKSLTDEKEISVSLEKMSNEDQEHVKNSYLEAHGSPQTHLSPGDSIGSKNAAPLQVHNIESAETNTAKAGSTIGMSDGGFGKEVMHLHPKTELKMPEDSSLSSKLTSQQRPRSASPGATPENLSKKPTTVCEFYSRGWCIKGNSCQFLHQKEGSKENLAEPSRKGDVLDGTGSRGEAERLSSSQERPDSSNTESSSKSQLQIQRALVKAYGEESHGSPHFHDDYNLHAVEKFHKVDIPRVGHTLARDECKSPFGLGPQFEYVDEKQSASEHFLSRRYLHEERLQREMPKREFLNDSLFSRGSSLTSSAVPEYRYYSGGSSTSFGPYLNNNNPFAHDRRTEEFSLRNHQSTFRLHGSHGSYSSSGPLSSTFNSSYQPLPASSFSSERLNIHETFDFDNRYHSSRSASLPRSSSPYFSRSDVENGLLRFVPRDFPASVRQKTETQDNSWEPSVPFRPSFHYTCASLSSPGSQYDPLVDSIEPRNIGNISLQSSERTINVDISGHFKGDPLLYGSQMPEYNLEKSLFPQPHEGISDKSNPVHGLGRQTSLAVTLRDAVADGGNSSVPKEEKHWIPDHLGENANGVEHDGDLRYQGDKSRISKESKAMKIFRAALVDFVKELVKPSWREGHLSKDAHKIVVKKSVEKVLSALQAHQIPNSTESINQYLSTSRPKLLKLVEGYVEKYAKAQASRVYMTEASQ